MNCKQTGHTREERAAIICREAAGTREAVHVPLALVSLLTFRSQWASLENAPPTHVHSPFDIFNLSWVNWDMCNSAVGIKEHLYIGEKTVLLKEQLF